MHVPQTSLKPRRRRDHEACSKKVFWLWLQRLVWFFSAGGPGLPKHCNIGKTSITLSINDLCIHLFLHTKLQCFGLLTQFRNMTFPILRFFFSKSSFRGGWFYIADSRRPRRWQPLRVHRMRRNSEGWMAAGASRCGEPIQSFGFSGSFIFSKVFGMEVFFFLPEVLFFVRILFWLR